MKTIALFVFFKVDAIHRDLHSFPTRRSSDLTRDEPHADPEKYRRLHVIIGDANLAEVSTYLKVETSDRKSTRLNSSHPSISYAVFCLKKKKKLLPTTVEITHSRLSTPGLYYS